MVSRKARVCWLAAIVAAVFTSAESRAAEAADKFVISFRLAKWKAAHFDDSATAKTYYETMRRIGCEAKQDVHNGHFDVSYRATRWRSISLKSDAEAHQWAHWLGKGGFETVFVQPARAGHLETVAYRLVRSRSGHFETLPQADFQADTLRMLGCEVKQAAHGGHYDVSYRCPHWRVIGLENHDNAHQWERWLKAQGFETRHEHNTAQSQGGTNRRR